MAAILIMVLTLFTIAFFACLLIFINHTTSTLKGKVDIVAYFNDSVAKDQIFAIQNVLLARTDINNVEYISKESALGRWRSQNYGNAKIRDVISEAFNPLPRSLEIKAEKPEDLEKINTFLNSAEYKPLIKEISYQKNKELITRLVKMTSFVKQAGWILSAVFVLISVLIVYNTIRLTIYARSGEIEIMKLVGSSDWYVQGPFIVEGLGYGIIAALSAALLLFTVLKLSVPAAEKYLDTNYASFLYSGGTMWLVLSTLVIAGLVLGITCSVFATRRFVKLK